jgi:hypothetical protein
MPLWWDEPGGFGSTRAEVERVLRALARGREPLPVLEVETYTWPALAGFAGSEPLPGLLQRELDFAANLLAS